MDRVLLTQNRLDLVEINNIVSHESCGAISFFVGTTRDNFEGRRVLLLEYEAYEPMAVKQMRAICDDMRTRWTDLVNIAIYHRLGSVPVKEASVVIAVSAPHRKSALDAISFAIEELKQRVPIWKKEQYEDDESSWKENKESWKRALKRSAIELEKCVIENDNITDNLVQIRADDDEIKRRIQCFVERKRMEINRNNVMDFTEPADTSGKDQLNEMSTCARTNGFVVKQEDSKCHLKVRRVTNRHGPQTKPDYKQTLSKLMLHESNVLKKENSLGSEGLCDRTVDIEEHLNLPVDGSKNLYERIKALEDRILYLESISPEYKHFMTESTFSAHSRLPTTKTKNDPELLQARKTYGSTELNEIIQQIQHANATAPLGRR